MRILRVIITESMVLFLAIILAGCSKKEYTETEGKEEELTIMIDGYGETARILEQVMKEFEAESGYEVKVLAPEKIYEELMQLDMAINEFPDVFATHGWSVKQYGKYLLPLNDMEFAEDIREDMRTFLEDEEGNVFVLPVDFSISGIIYNEDVLEDAGVSADQLRTWEAFEKACEKIKAAGFWPIYVSGKDRWPTGQLFEWAASSWFASCKNGAEKMKKGNFDVDTWREIASMIENWKNAGYINQDTVRTGYEEEAEAMASGRAAFCFHENSFAADVRKRNPDAHLGLLPIPAAREEDEPGLLTGEGIAFGVWKDSENQQKAMELLEYLARPEVIEKVTELSGNPAALTGAGEKEMEWQEYFEKHENVKLYPYFSREYLPYGLQDIICSVGNYILAGEEDAVERSVVIMEQNFEEKYSR